jgi:cell wall-associated NlpC family hydrolase
LFRREKWLKARAVALGVGFAMAAWPAGALAQGGGGVSAPDESSPPPPPPESTTPAPPEACTSGGGGVGDSSTCPTGKAKLLSTGQAIAPADAPGRVRRAIRYANMIVDKPYRLGGGHRLPWTLDSAYDCSGTVSWALHGGRMLRSPLPSGSFSGWGAPGLGRWITVFYNGGHAYAVIAGLRLDTSMVAGDGPGWSRHMRSSAGYRSRHPSRF